MAALLLAAGLAGCIGSDDTGDANPQISQSSTRAEELPAGLTMADGQVVAYNATSVTWAWTDTMPAAHTAPPPSTTFEMPPGLRLELVANGTWSAQANSLELHLLDATGEEICMDTGGFLSGRTADQPATLGCEAIVGPLDDTQTWTLQAYQSRIYLGQEGAHQMPGTDFEFTITTTLSVAPSTTTDGGAPGDLSVAPAWQPGDWWEIRLENPLTGNERTFTTVVADVGEGTAILGTAHPDEAEVVWLQATPLGKVTTGPLAWSIHDESFQAVTFPLEIGATWQTTFEGHPVDATVDDKSLTNATILYEGDDLELRAVYDGLAGMIVSMEGDSRTFADFAADASWKVIDHGTAYDGPIYVPMDRTLAFVSGKTVPTFYADLSAEELGQQLPVADRPGTVEEEVDRVHTRLTLGQIVGFPVESLLPQTGAFHEHVYAPNGEQWETTVHPYHVGGVQVGIYTTEDPGGMWDFERYGAGPGVSMSQGVAYTLVKYDAPGGEPKVLT